MSAELKEFPFRPDHLAESIGTAWEKYIIQENQRTPSKRANTWASSYEECERKLVLLMTEGDKVVPFEPQVLAKFHRGNDRERNLKIDLERVGQICEPRFKVVGQEEHFELRNRNGAIVMSGNFDCRLQFNRFLKPPLEIKDWNENLTARIKSFEDCFNSPWTKKGAYQLLMYLLGSGEPFGFILLGKSGLPALIPVSLEDHLELAEEFLARAERAFEHKEAGTLPGFIEDQSECKRCALNGIACDPPIKSEGAQIFTDPEIEEKLLRMVELEPSADEYESLDKWAKTTFRGVEIGMAGNALIQGKWQKNTIYDIGPAAKAQIKALTEPFKKTIEKGKFFLTITKV